jgi:DNA (cytosine-5)-methyltransferase 1
LKIARLKAGGQPRVLDLFAGCGGLSLGFRTAKCIIVGSVESDPIAALTHANNFFRGEPEDVIAIHAEPRDISTLEPEQLAQGFAWRSPRNAVDIIIGGPPCQAYARVGRSKLREVFDHPQAFLRDPRGNLYVRYLHYVRALQPLVVLVENVPDALNIGGHNTAEEMCEVLRELGYTCAYTLLNCVYYGVPQMRERMFLLAYHGALGTSPKFPKPTHWFTLPVGYEGSRSVALKSLRRNGNGSQSTMFEPATGYVPPPRPTPGLLPAVTASEALEDLPRITAHLEGLMKRGARRFDMVQPYRLDKGISSYARLMRTWPEFRAAQGVSDHVIRSLPRDYAIFRRMNPGDQYPEAFALAERMLKERVTQVQRRNGPLTTAEVEALRRMIVPPYDATKFPNKWRKMEADAPARTLMAHLGKDGYSHIHYDSAQARTISVREAARLQSFPDGFAFEGTMNPAFRQIGNAVPPLMALALAKEIRRGLKEVK